LKKKKDGKKGGRGGKGKPRRSRIMYTGKEGGKKKTSRVTGEGYH